jgi:hypothetical protein
MNTLNQKVYTFANADGEHDRDFVKKEIKVLVDGIQTKAKIENLFNGKSERSASKITGWSIMQQFTIEEGYMLYGDKKITFLCQDDGEIYQLVKINNAIVQMNDKTITDEYISDINEVLNAEEDFEEEEVSTVHIELNTETGEEKTVEGDGNENVDEEEYEEEIIETKWDKDSKSFLDRGYEIVESEEYRLMHKEGSIPVLAKIVSDEHYEEYSFVEKPSETLYVFKDFNEKKIQFDIS